MDGAANEVKWTEKFKEFFGTGLGYLLAGTLLGPDALHWVKDRESVATIAELGVALLS